MSKSFSSALKYNNVIFMSEIKTISMESAKSIIDKAMQKAQETKVPVCISVWGADREEKAFVRMDGAIPVAAEVARRKAFTPVLMGFFGLSTRGLGEFITNDPLVGDLATYPGITTIPGGLPIKNKEGSVIGGVGVSGGHYSQDEEVAQAGLEAL